MGVLRGLTISACGQLRAACNQFHTPLPSCSNPASTSDLHLEVGTCLTKMPVGHGRHKHVTGDYHRVSNNYRCLITKPSRFVAAKCPRVSEFKHYVPTIILFSLRGVHTADFWQCRRCHCTLVTVALSASVVPEFAWSEACYRDLAAWIMLKSNFSFSVSVFCLGPRVLSRPWFLNPEEPKLGHVQQKPLEQIRAHTNRSCLNGRLNSVPLSLSLSLSLSLTLPLCV